VEGFAEAGEYSIASDPAGRGYALAHLAGQARQHFPFANLRRLSLHDCRRGRGCQERAGGSRAKLESVQRLLDASVMLAWRTVTRPSTWFEELRDLCGCAHCKGEPNYPITGQ